MSYYNDPVMPKSITKEVRKELNEVLRINNQLRSEVAILRSQLAESQARECQMQGILGTLISWLHGNGLNTADVDRLLRTLEDGTTKEESDVNGRPA